MPLLLLLLRLQLRLLPLTRLLRPRLLRLTPARHLRLARLLRLLTPAPRLPPQRLRLTSRSSKS